MFPARSVADRVHPAGPDRAQAEAIVSRYGRTPLDYFKLWPDKSYYLSPSRQSVVAYRVACSVAVSLGDPVGPADELEPTVRSFLDFCADRGWSAAFHQVLPDFLAMYRRQGFSVLKIGEEALVDLERFATRTIRLPSFRKPRRRLGAQGYASRVRSGLIRSACSMKRRRFLASGCHCRAVVNGPSRSAGSIAATWRGTRW